MKLIMLVVTLLPVQLYCQADGIIAKAELTNRVVMEDCPHVALRISVTNNSSRSIMIPDSTQILFYPEAYDYGDVGYELRLKNSKKNIHPEGFVDGDLIIPFQTVDSGQTKTVDAFLERHLVRKNKTYQITLILKVRIPGSSRWEYKEVEVRSNTIFFKLDPSEKFFVYAQ
jgi:hypothetical protein